MWINDTNCTAWARLHLLPAIGFNAGSVAVRRERLIAYRMGDMWWPHVERTEPSALAVRRIIEAAARSLLSGGGFVKI